MKLASIEEMRRIESETDARGHSYDQMMERAGSLVVKVIEEAMLTPGSRFLILVGPGNNGGDGLVAAHLLLEEGYEITLYIWRRDVRNDPRLRRLRRRRRGIRVLFADNDPECLNLQQALLETDEVIDALLGTGGTRPIEGALALILDTVRREIEARNDKVMETLRAQPAPQLLLPIFAAMNFAPILGKIDGWTDETEEEDEDEFPDYLAHDVIDPWLGLSKSSAPPADSTVAGSDSDSRRLMFPLHVLAVDCPTGLNCDSGALDPHALPAELTVTFAYPKWGHLQEPGASACGQLMVGDIGIPKELDDTLSTELADPRMVGVWLPDRPVDAHKGAFGKAMIVGGSVNYTGAVYLSGAAAVRSGAGLVTLAIPDPLHALLAASLPEATWQPLPAKDGRFAASGVELLLPAVEGYDALLVGPGLTTQEGPYEFVTRLFSSAGLNRDAWRGRVVVDADALNCLASVADWPTRLPEGSILTPHPGEMARLTGESVAAINGKRIASARKWSERWGHVVVLKGPYTVIAAPTGKLIVLPFALPLLATGGSGDLLAGAITAFLAQGLGGVEAATCGAYLHAQAALLLQREIPHAPIAASDLLTRFRQALGQLYFGLRRSF